MQLRRPVRRPHRVNASGFLPTQIGGLVLWLRADKGITLGTGVSAWADQSGTGDPNKNVVQGTGSQQPTLNAADGSYNNQKTLSFSRAASQFLRSAAWASALPTPRTLFIVGNFDGAAATEYITDDLTVNQDGISNNATSVGLFATAGATLIGSVPSNAAPLAIAALFSSSGALFANAKTALVTGSTGTATMTGLNLGVAGNTTAFLNGKVAEVIIYNSDIGATNRARVWSYLGARYGIAVGP